MLQLQHFGVEFILFAQLCIKELVGLGEKNLVGVFEILILRFIICHFGSGIALCVKYFS